MKLSDLIIDPASLGKRFWLVDVIPSYAYQNGQRTDTVTGYRYTVALPDKGLDKINMRIDGQQRMDSSKSALTASNRICTGRAASTSWAHAPRVSLR